MPNEPFRIYCAVYLLLFDGECVLLAGRRGTGFEDGNYGLVSGHMDGSETARAAMRREAWEEAGIVVHEHDLELALTMHRYSPDREYIDLFFVGRSWEGEPQVREPHKCDELQWFRASELPENVVPYVREAIDCYLRSARYCEVGWETGEMR